MMHQESWVGMMMLVEEHCKDIMRESNHRRMVNCCRMNKMLMNKVLVSGPELNENKLNLPKTVVLWLHKMGESGK